MSARIQPRRFGALKFVHVAVYPERDIGALVDKHGLLPVIEALARVCDEASDRAEAAGDDDAVAKCTHAAAALDELSGYLEGL